MPRRPAGIIRKIPLFLIASVIGKEVKRAGEELVRIIVKKAKGHCYDISVRTRSVERLLRPAVPRAVAVPGPCGYDAGVADP